MSLIPLEFEEEEKELEPLNFDDLPPLDFGDEPAAAPPLPGVGPELGEPPRDSLPNRRSMSKCREGKKPFPP